MGVTGAVMMLICPLVFRMLTPDAEVRTLAAQALRIGLLGGAALRRVDRGGGRSARRGRYAGAESDESGAASGASGWGWRSC